MSELSEIKHEITETNKLLSTYIAGNDSRLKYIEEKQHNHNEILSKKDGGLEIRVDRLDQKEMTRARSNKIFITALSSLVAERMWSFFKP